MPPEPAPVSVIIPAYNAEATIGRALQSIAAQSLAPAEVIVVDDGSKDASADAAERMRAAMGPIRLVVITQKNQGAGAARNRAIAEATQPYLAFLDADDEWLPAKLERSMQVMQEGDYLLVAHDYLDTTPDGDRHIDCRQRFEEGPDPYITLYLKGYIPSISVVTKRDAVITAGGFDESLRNAQDFDLWLKLLAEPGTRFTLFGEALARYHHVAGSIMTHTERRIACCTKIAIRYLPALKARHANAFSNLMRRLAFIHLEAARAEPKKKWKYLANGSISVISNANVPFPEQSPKRACQILLSAVWVFGTLGIYLWQFKEYLDPALRILGFKS